MQSRRSKVLFLLAGDRSKASSRVRGYWLAEAMAELGFCCRLHHDNSRLGLLAFALAMLRTDIVIFQKTYSRYHLLLLRCARLLGKPVYLDVDDAPSRSKHAITLRNFTAMAQAATGVFAGCAELEEYVHHLGGTAHLVPSGIKAGNYLPARGSVAGTPVCIGWIGNGAHYSEDLQALLHEPLLRLALHRPLKFKIVGALGDPGLLACFAGSDSLEVEIIDHIDWADPGAVRSALDDFDIGVYPLLPKTFNKYKCGFKALEYMASSIAVVATPYGANRDIISAAVDGYFATTADDWYEALRLLADDAALRAQAGRAGRSKIEATYSIEHIAEQVRDILLPHTRAADNHHG